MRILTSHIATVTSRAHRLGACAVHRFDSGWEVPWCSAGYSRPADLAGLWRRAQMSCCRRQSRPSIGPPTLAPSPHLPPNFSPASSFRIGQTSLRGQLCSRETVRRIELKGQQPQCSIFGQLATVEILCTLPGLLSLHPGKVKLQAQEVSATQAFIASLF